METQVGFAVNEREHVIYILEFKRVSDTSEQYVSETQKLAETQHLAVRQGLKSLFKGTQWTVEQLSCVAGHKSVSAIRRRPRISRRSGFRDRVIRWKQRQFFWGGGRHWGKEDRFHGSQDGRRRMPVNIHRVKSLGRELKVSTSS